MTETQPRAETGQEQEVQRNEEQRYKTLAVKVEERLHAQLQFIAQLSDSTIAEEIRRSIEARIDVAQDDPALIARAEEVRQEIEREAAARKAAIAGFLGGPAVAAVTSFGAEEGATRRRTTK